MNKKPKPVAKSCSSFTSKNGALLWIVAVLAALGILYGLGILYDLVLSGYTPEESEGPIVITDSKGNELTGEPESPPSNEDSSNKSL